MRNSRLLPTILVTFGVVVGCSSTPDQQTVTLPTAGTGGTMPSGGTGTGGMPVGTAGGGAGPTAGNAPVGGMNGGSGGSAPVAGSGGSGGSGGSSGSGGGGGSGGGDDPNKKVLFDGSPATFNAWKSVRNGGNNPWKSNADGTMTVVTNTGDIQSTETFNDVFVHVEYMTPRITSAGGGQERGNSGIYLKGSYEVQVLDSYNLPPANDGCGAIYGISAPLTSACFDAEEWNVYEIEFKAQVCNGNQKTANANFPEVKLNGEVVQQNVAVPGTTQAGQNEDCAPKGILLQDHSSILPVSYRTIWVIPRN